MVILCELKQSTRGSRPEPSHPPTHLSVAVVSARRQAAELLHPSMEVSLANRLTIHKALITMAGYLSLSG